MRHSLIRRACARFSFRSLLAGLLATSLAVSGATDDSANLVRLWRLDCGTMVIEDIGYFSDAFAYEGQAATISNGCYLIQHGSRHLLWDAGLPLETLGNTTAQDGWTEHLDTTLSAQLESLGLRPQDIEFIGISHFHGDHVGQAGEFAAATLLIGSSDEAWLRARPPGNALRRLAAWFEGDATMIAHEGDHDVFGDGRVVILSMPGHTPGHSALLVRLAETGPVLLTGDLFHFRREVGKRNVSRWNTSRADTLASIERFESIVANLDATVIVQHEPDDIGRLPAFPEAAR